MSEISQPQSKHFMQDWADKLAAELEVECEAADTPDLTSLLDVTRLIAHNVARPAGPIATYYIGLAAGLAAGSSATAEKATALITELVNQYIVENKADDLELSETQEGSA